MPSTSPNQPNPRSQEKTNLQGTPGPPEDPNIKPCNARPSFGFPAQNQGELTCRGHTPNQQSQPQLDQETPDLPRHAQSCSCHHPHRQWSHGQFYIPTGCRQILLCSFSCIKYSRSICQRCHRCLQ